MTLTSANVNLFRILRIVVAVVWACLCTFGSVYRAAIHSQEASSLYDSSCRGPQQL